MNEFFFKFCEQSPLLGVARAPRFGPRLSKEVDLKLRMRRGSRGTPPGLPPPLGESGGHPHNNSRRL